MRYKAPYGSPDPDAPYVDKDVPGAIAGSKVPRQAIEQPMREIGHTIDFFLGNGADYSAQDTNDLQQLRKAIQAAPLKSGYYVDSGTANAIVVTGVPGLTAYADGIKLRIKKSSSNTGAVTLNVNGIGVESVIDQDGPSHVAGDLRATEIIEVTRVNGVWTVQRNSSSLTRRGLIELATAAEAIAGVDAARAISPATMWAAYRSGDYYAAGGTANALTITPVPALTSYVDGQQFFIRAASTNTGPMTINASGLGGLPLQDFDGAAIAAGDITAGELFNVTVFNGATVFVLGKNTVSASLTRRGLIELATGAEAIAGVDAVRAITPATFWSAKRSGDYYAAGGSANVLTITPVPAITSYVDGQSFDIRIGINNTGPVTLNANGLGALPLIDASGASVVAGDLTAGELIKATVFNGGAQFILSKYTSSASATKRGLIELATSAEVAALSDQSRAITPFTLEAMFPDTTQRGIIRTATAAEARARSLSGIAVSPLSLAPLLGVAFRGAVAFAGIPAGNSFSFNPATYGLTGADWALVLLWGGGGGGSATSSGAGAGGAAGGCAIKMIQGVTALTITLGASGIANNAGGNGTAGGTSSFGALFSATGGNGGAGGATNGGNGVGGDVNIVGGSGGDVLSIDEWGIGGSAFMFGQNGMNSTGGGAYGSGGSASINNAYNGQPGYCLVFY